MNPSAPLPSQRRGPGLFWPVILIGAGVLLLLTNLGVLPATIWPSLWRLWPVVLILVGLDVLLGRRSVWGGVLSAVLALLVVGIVIAVVLYAPVNSRLYDGGITLNLEPRVFGAVEMNSRHIADPLAGVREADVRIAFPGGPGSISALSDSTNLIEGDVTYRGTLQHSYSASAGRAQVVLDTSFLGLGFAWPDSGSPRWTLQLNPQVEYDLSMDTGSGSYTLDLAQLKLRSLYLDSGSGHVEVKLPEGGQYRAELNTGSGSVVIRLPAGTAARVEWDGGSGSFNAPGMHKVSGGRRDGVYETPGFSQTGSYVTLQLNSGSGSVMVE